MLLQQEGFNMFIQAKKQGKKIFVFMMCTVGCMALASPFLGQKISRLSTITKSKSVVPVSAMCYEPHVLNNTKKLNELLRSLGFERVSINRENDGLYKHNPEARFTVIASGALYPLMGHKGKVAAPMHNMLEQYDKESSQLYVDVESFYKNWRRAGSDEHKDIASAYSWLQERNNGLKTVAYGQCAGAYFLLRFLANMSPCEQKNISGALLDSTWYSPEVISHTAIQESFRKLIEKKVSQIYREKYNEKIN